MCVRACDPGDVRQLHAQVESEALSVGLARQGNIIQHAASCFTMQGGGAAERTAVRSRPCLALQGPALPFVEARLGSLGPSPPSHHRVMSECVFLPNDDQKLTPPAWQRAHTLCCWQRSQISIVPSRLPSDTIQASVTKNQWQSRSRLQ